MASNKEAVSVVIYRQNLGKQTEEPEFFLTHQRHSPKKPNNGVYQLIGGEIEANEMPLDAVIRTLRSKLVGLNKDSSESQLRRTLGAWGKHQTTAEGLIRSFYLAAEDLPIPSSELQMNPNKQLEGIWFTTEQLSLIAIAYLGQPIIESLVKRKIVS